MNDVFAVYKNLHGRQTSYLSIAGMPLVPGGVKRYFQYYRLGILAAMVRHCLD